MSSRSSASSWLSIAAPQLPEEEERVPLAEAPHAHESLKSAPRSSSSTSSSSSAFTPPTVDVEDWMSRAEQAMSGFAEPSAEPSVFESSSACSPPPPTPPAVATSRSSSLASAAGALALTAALYALSPNSKARIAASSPAAPHQLICPPAPLPTPCPVCPLLEPPPSVDASPLVALHLIAGVLLVRGSSLLRGGKSPAIVQAAEAPPPLPLKKKKTPRTRKSDLGGWTGGGSCWTSVGKRRSVRLMLASAGEA